MGDTRSLDYRAHTDDFGRYTRFARVCLTDHLQTERHMENQINMKWTLGLPTGLDGSFTAEALKTAETNPSVTTVA